MSKTSFCPRKGVDFINALKLIRTLDVRGIVMREKVIEKKLVDAVKAYGGICPKFVSPGFDGMPDRLVLLPGGCLAFVEVKATGKKPRDLQRARHTMLRRLGFWVYVLDDERQIEGILKMIGGDAG